MIKVRNLKKSYNNIQALKGISMDIQKGEFYGMLGPNGAGKTTTINILSTILESDSGEVMLNGFNLKDDIKKCKRIIGVVPQEISLYDELSAYDNLMFWGSLYNVDSSKLKKNVNSTLEMVGLAERKSDKVKTYSGGMKRRINIASAILHSPEILFMDEPTVGIDPQSRNLIYEVVEQLHNKGMTIIYTTHYMEEAERLCNRIGIIDNGEIIAEGTLDELKSKTKAEDAIILKLAENSDINKITKLKDTIKLKIQVADNTLNIFSSNAKAMLPGVIEQITKFGLEINQIEIQRSNLESIFLNLTGKQLRD